MADINYFLKPASWKVLTGGGPLLSKFLPAKGSTIRIERHAARSTKIRVVGIDGRGTTRVLLEDFKFQKEKGRLELKKLDFVVVIEDAKANGRNRVRAKVERGAALQGQASTPLPGQDITGTWGAEANPGGGGKKAVRPPES